MAKLVYAYTSPISIAVKQSYLIIKCKSYYWILVAYGKVIKMEFLSSLFLLFYFIENYGNDYSNRYYTLLKLAWIFDILCLFYNSIEKKIEIQKCA